MTGITKNKVLVINNSGWGERKKINALVTKSFNYTVENTYGFKKKVNMKPEEKLFDHVREVIYELHMVDFNIIEIIFSTGWYV